MLPLDGYVRVSRVGAREGEGFISPDVQEQAIRDWAKRSNAEVVMQPHELNVSGGTMDRPIFNDVMDRIRQGKSGGVVVYKMDRFARTLLGAVSTLAELGERDAIFASATEPELDYSTPAGRAFMQQMFVFAEFTRSTLKEGWATSARHAIERGVHISPHGHLGYDRAKGRLTPNTQAGIAREIFERRVGGDTWVAIAEWVNDVAPRDDGKRWTAQAMQRHCAKRVYRGEASRYVNQDKDGRGPIINPNAHEALVSEDLWRAAQMKPRVTKSHNNDTLPLLSGLLRCAGCRYSLSLGRGPKGERLYRCRRTHTSGTCEHPAYVVGDHIEAHVEGLLLSEIDGTTRLVPDSSERDAARAELAEARSQLEDFRGDRAARTKLGPDWHDWLDDYLDAVRKAEAKVDRLEAKADAAASGLTRDHYLGLPVEDRREVLGGFVDAVFVRKSRGRGRNVDPIATRTRVLWRGQGPDDLPRRRITNPIVPFDFEENVEAGVAAA